MMTKPDTTVDTSAVARRAYELFLARGGEHGHDLEDWLRAESELRPKAVTSTPTKLTTATVKPPVTPNTAPTFDPRRPTVPPTTTTAPAKPRKNGKR